MRASLLGALAVGFALGVLCLAVALKVSGTLPAPFARAPETAPADRSAPPGAASLPDLANIPKPPALEPPPFELPQSVGTQPSAATQPSHGEASRLVAEDHPVMPVAGVDAARLTDTFDEVRDGHKHEALDIPAARGTPVRAAVEGNVVKLFTSKQGGLTVYQFDDSGNLCYYYAHLERYAPGLKEGALLRPGDVLGYVGTSGDAPPNAPHLHFAVFRLGPDKKWYHGTAIDPLPLLR